MRKWPGVESEAQELADTIMRRVAETLRNAGINAAISAPQLPELIRLYLAAAYKAGQERGAG